MRCAIVFIFFTFYSCTGYKIVQDSNPLKQFEVKSLYIPVFLNESTYPNVSGEFTKKFVEYFSTYKSLKIENFNYKKADAVLLGILYNAAGNKHDQNFDILTFKKSDEVDSGATSQRQVFYVPSVLKVKIKLRLILVKKPSKELMNALRTRYSSLIVHHSRIIFNKTFDLEKELVIDFYENSDSGKYNEINSTNYVESLNHTLSSIADDAISKLENEIIYAF